LLEGLAISQARRYPRGNHYPSLPTQEPELVRVDIAALMIAFGDLIRRLPRETIYQVQPQEVTVDLRKAHILSLFDDCDSLVFEELFADDRRKIVMVVTFIAILELVRVGILRLEQATRFSPIRLCKGEDESASQLESA
jgi:segregation and condensation protein A